MYIKNTSELINSGNEHAVHFEFGEGVEGGLIAFSFVSVRLTPWGTNDNGVKTFYHSISDKQQAAFQ